MNTVLKTCTLALALIALPVSASAQETDTTQNDAVTTSSENDGVAGNERQGFPWGLLGLIGLAGLAGRRAVEERREVKLGGPTDGPRSH